VRRCRMSLIRCTMTINVTCKDRYQSFFLPSGIENAGLIYNTHVSFFLVPFSFLKHCSFLHEISQLFIMYAFKYYLLFTGLIVAAFQNPHEKGAKYARKSIPRIPTRDAPRMETTSLFLNNKTTSKYFTIFGDPELR
jgi:hypothetical protein